MNEQFLFTALICLLLSGCASAPTQQPAPLPWHLADGAAIFGDAVTSAEVPSADVLALSPDMETFLDDDILENRLSFARMRHILRKLEKEGYYDGVYNADATFTAAETFRQKHGNCLSYTNMFVALARAADLDVSYQVVDVPPTWHADSGFLIRNKHINVLVANIKLSRDKVSDYTIDFNIVNPEGEFTRTRVSDSYAESLFYANRSVDMLLAKQPRKAFAYLRHALELAPENLDHWLNLGAFYSREGFAEQALEVFSAVEQREPENRTALWGVARAHQALGNQAIADQYIQRVQTYQLSNPYYFLALAQQAYERKAYQESLDAINSAIALRKKNARFHFMRGLVQAQLGEMDAARESFELASGLGDYRDLKLQYLHSLLAVDGVRVQG